LMFEGYNKGTPRIGRGGDEKTQQLRSASRPSEREKRNPACGGRNMYTSGKKGCMPTQN